MGIYKNIAASRSIKALKENNALITAKVKPFWQNLSERERLLIIIAASIIGFLFCYLIILEPLKMKLSDKVTRIESQQNDVNWMEQQLPLVQQLRQQTPVLIREDDRPLITLIEQLLNDFKLREATQKIASESNSIQVLIEAAPFETILKWIHELGKFGVTVQRFDVTPHETGEGNVIASINLEK